MRKFLLLACVLAPAAALAIGIQLDLSIQKTFTSCSSGGSAAQTVAQGTYLVTVTGSDVSMCMADSASTCAANGVTLPLGTVFLQTFGKGGQSVSCRSSASTGNLQFTRTLNE